MNTQVLQGRKPRTLWLPVPKPDLCDRAQQLSRNYQCELAQLLLLGLLHPRLSPSWQPTRLLTLIQKHESLYWEFDQHGCRLSTSII